MIGVKLDNAGWIKVSTLLDRIRHYRPQITRERLLEIVETNDKKRFAFSEDREMIRASQGHSVVVDLGLPPCLPPPSLYHGTVKQNIMSIRANGLLRGQRNHVHLSPDKDTAIRVGSRHGKPIVLRIEAERMAQSGFSFYMSENGVWLTEYVPPSFVVIPDDY